MRNYLREKAGDQSHSFDPCHQDIGAGYQRSTGLIDMVEGINCSIACLVCRELGHDRGVIDGEYRINSLLNKCRFVLQFGDACPCKSINFRTSTMGCVDGGGL